MSHQPLSAGKNKEKKANFVFFLIAKMEYK